MSIPCWPKKAASSAAPAHDPEDQQDRDDRGDRNPAARSGRRRGFPRYVLERDAAALGDPACSVPVALLLDVTRSEVLATRTPEQIRYVAQYLEPYAERYRRLLHALAHDELDWDRAAAAQNLASLVEPSPEILELQP